MTSLESTTSRPGRFVLLALAGAVAASVATIAPADAQDFDRVMVRTHVSGIFLDATSATTEGLDLSVENTITMGADLTLFATPNIGVNLLAAFIAPEVIQETDEGEASLGSISALPPALTVQYHFLPDQTFRPYLGVGGSWVTVLDETGALEDLAVDIDDGFGLVGQAGFNAAVVDGVFVMADFRWVEIMNDPEVAVQGTVADELDFRHFILSGGVGFSF